MAFLSKYRYEIALAAVIIIAAAFRFYRLDVQSLWYDELFTINWTNPDVSWRQFVIYLQPDQHPPLYFALQRLAFSAFGYTEWVTRLVAALSGVLCVWAIYLLGRQLKDKKLGIILAVMLAANQYHIRYSQEARPYTLTVLLAILSYLFFIRLVKHLRRKDMLWYILFSSALIYTNFFGFLLMLSQAIFALIIWIMEREEKKKVFVTFSVAGLLILLSYLPWAQYMVKQAGLQPFWLKAERPWFFLYYYYTYFGGERLLVPFLVLGPLVYIVHLYKDDIAHFRPRKNDLHLSALYILLSISVPFLVLYVRSELYGPVLQLRYTIFTIPAMFLLVGYGIRLVKPETLIAPLTILFLLFSAYNLVYRHRYYSYPQEKQYRQAAAYMAKEGNNAVILNRVSGWHMKFYTKKFGHTGRLIRERKHQAVDSILKQVPGYEIDTFWLVDGFLDAPLWKSVQQRLDMSYDRIKHREFREMSVELYARKADTARRTDHKTTDYTDANPAQ